MKTHGLGNLDAQGISELRQTILKVIDDGNPARPITKQWLLWSLAETTANYERLDFVDAIVQAVIQKAAPQAVKVENGCYVCRDTNYGFGFGRSVATCVKCNRLICREHAQASGDQCQRECVAVNLVVRDAIAEEVMN